MVDINDILNEMKILLGKSSTDTFENPELAESSASIALSTCQITDDAKIMAMYACYLYTEARDTKDIDDGDEAITNRYYKMYKTAVKELTEVKIDINDDDGAAELDGAVYNDDLDYDTTY